MALGPASFSQSTMVSFNDVAAKIGAVAVKSGVVVTKEGTGGSVCDVALIMSSSVGAGGSGLVMCRLRLCLIMKAPALAWRRLFLALGLEKS